MKNKEMMKKTKKKQSCDTALRDRSFFPFLRFVQVKDRRWQLILKLQLIWKKSTNFKECRLPNSTVDKNIHKRSDKYNIWGNIPGWQRQCQMNYLISQIPIILITAEVFDKDVLTWHWWSYCCHQDTFNTELPVTAQSAWQGHGAIQRS